MKPVNKNQELNLDVKLPGTKNKNARWIAGIATILPVMVLLYHYLQPLVDYLAYHVFPLKEG
ncbi:MAG: hypothetical protein ACOCUL_04015, partial [Bacteroidota bacterium]